MAKTKHGWRDTSTRSNGCSVLMAGVQLDADLKRERRGCKAAESRRADGRRPAGPLLKLKRREEVEMEQGNTSATKRRAKLCPRRVFLGQMLECEGERCAWWRGKGCAVTEVAWWLSELWTALPTVKQEGGAENET